MGFQTAALRSESAALRSESAALGFCSAAFCRDAWFRVSLRDGGVYPGRAGWLLLSAFCRGTRFRVSSFDRAIYPCRRVLPRSTLSHSSFYGGVYPGRRRARPSALRLGPHGLPALQRNAKSPQAPQTAAEPAFANATYRDMSRRVETPHQQQPPRRPASCCRPWSCPASVPIAGNDSRRQARIAEAENAPEMRSEATIRREAAQTEGRAHERQRREVAARRRAQAARISPEPDRASRRRRWLQGCADPAEKAVDCARCHPHHNSKRPSANAGNRPPRPRPRGESAIWARLSRRRNSASEAKHLPEKRISPSPEASPKGRLRGVFD